MYNYLNLDENSSEIPFTLIENQFNQNYFILELVFNK